jgi:uncharacterized protein YjbJ (UPF0337 family)
MIELETPTQEMLKGRWKQVRGRIQEQWGELTESDLDQIAGQRDQLIGLLQEKYDLTREEAAEQLDDFTHTYETRREELESRELSLPFETPEPWKVQAGVAAALGTIMLAVAFYLYRKAHGENG